MNVWINGKVRSRVDWRDRGLQYGDGLFETMRVRRGAVRLLDYHLERLAAGCARLGLPLPDAALLRREIRRAAALADEAVVKLIVTRGIGVRGYRPTGRERPTRIVSVQPLGSRAAAAPPPAWTLRLCRTRLGWNEALAGLKTLNRLESVLARAEWRGSAVAEGLMLDADEHVVCGTMSNLFIRRGRILATPSLDRCGVAGVMRRFVLASARSAGLRPQERHLRIADLNAAEEVFMTNAVVGVMPVAEIRAGSLRIRPPERAAAGRLRALLEDA
ncbi:MAG: aminodeoxychorismate lyase [Gammaproteobacteria bacterium]|nr:aminodeoxychorismate lyase [Gammaproteobacteria bacterium]